MRKIILFLLLASLSACQGSQTMKGISSMNYNYKDGPWNTDYSGFTNSKSFWCSGYDCGSSTGGDAGNGPDHTSVMDSGSSDSGN